MNRWEVSAANRRAIREVLAFVKPRRRFLCSAHVRADADALGSAMAVMWMLRRLGKRAHTVTDRGVQPALKFLPGASEAGADPEDLRPPYDAVFTTDSGDFSRLERIAEALPKGTPVVNIDHHKSNTRFGVVNWIDPGYAATGEMVFDLVRASGVKVDGRIALPLYAAILTDTGRFSYSNTTRRTHLMAAELLQYGVRPGKVHQHVYRDKELEELGLLARIIGATKVECGGRLAWVSMTRRMIAEARHDPMETQDFIDPLKAIQGVRLALMLRENEDHKTVKLSIRTDEGVDATLLARKWKGGGHARAAGATFPGTIREAERVVVREARRYV